MVARRGIGYAEPPSCTIAISARAVGSCASRAAWTHDAGHTATTSSPKPKAAATCPATSRRCAVAVMAGRHERRLMVFDKDAIFHKCTNGHTRPYSSLVCSLCMGKGKNVNAYRYCRELEDKIKGVSQEDLNPCRAPYGERCSCTHCQIIRHDLYQ